MSTPSRRARLWIINQFRQVSGVVRVDAYPGPRGCGKDLVIYVDSNHGSGADHVYEILSEAAGRFPAGAAPETSVLGLRELGVRTLEELEQRLPRDPDTETVFGG